MTSEAGFDLLEIPLMDPWSFEPTQASRSLREHGLAATASLGLTAQTDLSSEDPSVVARGEETLNRCLEIVHDLEADYLCGVIYSAMQKYSRPATEAGRRNSAEALQRLAERAASLGIRLGLEVVNRYESNLLNTGRQALAFIEEIGHPNVYLHLDTYHMNIEEPDLLSPVLAAGKKLGYVHIGESHRGYLGSGSVDFGAFFRGLALIGYDGPVVFESFSSAVVDDNLSNTLGVWRNLWDDSANLGSHANSFIRGQLASVSSIDKH
ncbi:sugar phosphate isomerase/epimerase [Arthrobacter sp. C9C5]|uniref:sugar phosphate isomerase/epimerase family protein n=1 Tax=Arthrobacter sp. C9C5 TaxID=2735267 RepID=UPI00201C9087|nr:sugar phosphate isomerase/epimerase [Arthrobacter sp. C9C5]